MLPAHSLEKSADQDRPVSGDPSLRQVSTPDRQVVDPILQRIFAAHNGGSYLTPVDLSLSSGAPRRMALIGSCLLESFVFHGWNASNCVVDLITVNHAGDLPNKPSHGGTVSDYDLQVVHIPLRTVLPDTTLWRLPHESIEAHENAFGQVCERLAFQLRSRMEWNARHGLLTFVMNFLVPQRNPMGCLFPRYDLRNPEYFVCKLNEYLEGLVRESKNAYILDIDRISASLGRRFIQDDSVCLMSHNALIWDTDPDMSRIEPLARMSQHYDLPAPALARDAVWNEILCMYRVVRQTDSVKLVVVDADDTLWRGVSGDMTDVGQFMIEGWPVGVVEALCYLKKRGVLLAMISKNDEVRLREIWPKVLGGRLELEDFAAIRVNWRQKAENMQEILEDTSLLPRNVVFVDDSPVERAAMQGAYPEMRVVGRHPYYLRRILLWSSEMQVAAVSEESSRRTAMVQAQLARESRRREMSREEFLQAAAPTVRLMAIDGLDHSKFPRAFELINKTNQFNTIGRRWRWEEFREFFGSGGSVRVFEVADSYTDYGLVGVILLRSDHIEQWVMSCRVLGYDIERAVMHRLVESIRLDRERRVYGTIVETPANIPCRDLFQKCGFVRVGGGECQGSCRLGFVTSCLLS
jgi:FkbH-like protein